MLKILLGFIGLFFASSSQQQHPLLFNLTNRTKRPLERPILLRSKIYKLDDNRYP